MLRLDDVPNTIDQANLGGVPNTADASFLSSGRDHEASTTFVVWPAREGARLISVRISTRELSDLADVPFGIDNTKINAALRAHRAYLERRANEELADGASEVVLDVGSLYPVR